VVLAKIAETLCLMAGVMGVLRKRAQVEEIKANQLPNQVVPAQEETIPVEERATLGIAAALEEILGMAAPLEETLGMAAALEETLRMEATLEVKDSLRSVAAESALSSEEIIQALAFLWLDMKILQAIQ